MYGVHPFKTRGRLSLLPCTVSPNLKEKKVIALKEFHLEADSSHLNTTALESTKSLFPNPCPTPLPGNTRNLLKKTSKFKKSKRTKYL